MKRFFIRKFLSLSLTFLTLTLLGCTVSRDFGSYKGRVLDYDTGEPIIGAVVFVAYETEFVLSPAGPVPKVVGTVEQLTNSNGEFKIPIHTINSFNLLHRWGQYRGLYIYKPGYALFPNDSSQTNSSIELINNNLPVDQHITIKIKKIKTAYERRTHLNSINISKLLPADMTKSIERLIEEEEKNLLEVEASQK